MKEVIKFSFAEIKKRAGIANCIIKKSALCCNSISCFGPLEKNSRDRFCQTLLL